jgi:hypothetical protein
MLKAHYRSPLPAVGSLAEFSADVGVTRTPGLGDHAAGLTPMHGVSWPSWGEN